jgi:hypothetical protein
LVVGMSETSKNNKFEIFYLKNGHVYKVKKKKEITKQVI